MKRLYIFLILIMAPIFVEAQVQFDWLQKTGTTGTNNDHINSITTDNSGNIYVTGYVQAPSLSNVEVFGEFLPSSGGTEFFVAKLDKDGNEIWVTIGGGSTSSDVGNDIAYDPVNNLVWVVGELEGATTLTVSYADDDPFNDLTYTFDLSWGNPDAFLFGFDVTNGVLITGDVFGGTNTDRGKGVTVDVNTGEVYITGFLRSTAVSTYFGPTDLIGGELYIPSSTGLEDDLFIAKYYYDSGNDILLADWGYSGNSTGSARGWEVELGYVGATDPDVYPIIIGDFQDNLFFNDIDGINAGSVGPAAGVDVFLAVYDEFGDYQASIRGGSPGTDFGLDLTLGEGAIYATGKVGGDATFDGLTSISSFGSDDIWVGKFTFNTAPSFSADWIRVAGSAGFDRGTSITVSDSDNPVVAGYFSNTATFNNPDGNLSLTSQGSNDIFVSTFNKSNGASTNVFRAGGSDNDGADEHSIAFNNGSFILGGSFQSQDADFLNLNLAADVNTNTDIYLGVFSEQTITTSQLTEVTTLPGSSNMNYEWANFNGNGMGLISIGDGYRYFSNDGSNTFTENSFGPFFSFGHVDAGDFNNDNVPDFLASGRFPASQDLPEREALSIEDIGTGSFLQTLIPGIESIHWGDFNNDGILDFVESGQNSRLNFVDPTSPGSLFAGDTDTFANLVNSSVDVGDYDNDGNLDILLTGNDETNTPRAILYQNTQDGFVDSGIALTGVDGDETTDLLVDYDSDGDLDILLSGTDDTDTRIVKIYANNSDGTFTEDTSLGDLVAGYTKFDFGDYDNDGDLDIVATGSPNTNIFERDAGSYVKVENFDVGGDQFGAVKWGDYDNDGDLDLVLSRTDGSGGYETAIYNNAETVSNTPPTVPTNLGFEQNGLTIRLFWDGSSDDYTPGAAISYNVYIGSATGGLDVLSPSANLSNGLRYIVGNGNAGFTEEIFLNISNLAPGDYTWSVQAIDGSYIGSAFATESTFTVVATDSDAPVVSDLSTPLIQVSGGTEVTATITDDSNFAAELRWLKLTDLPSGFDQNSFDPSLWNLGTLSTTDNSTYSYTFNDSDFDDVGIVFLILATDEFGNSIQPADFQFAVIRTQFNQTEISVNTGSEQTDYRLVSFPQEANQSVADVFSEYESYDKTIWRLFRFSNDNFSELNFNSVLSPGVGYWFITTLSTTPKISGNAVNVSFDTPFLLNLSSGWNAIGNPYIFGISWPKVIAYNIAIGNISEASTLADLYTYNGGWSTSSTLGAFQGAYVESPGTVTLAVPAFIESINARTKNIVPTELDQAEWYLDMELSNQTTFYNVSRIGMHPDAENELDSFDGSTIPFQFDYLDTRFGNFSTDISRDIVNTQTSYTWEFKVRSSFEGEITTLKWDNGNFGENDLTVYLHDLTTLEVIDMREQSSYSFTVNEERDFELIYGSEQKANQSLLSETLETAQVYPNPSTAEVNISFVVPAGGRSIRIDVIDIMGKSVSTILNADLNEGHHKLTWDRQTSSGKATGVYMMRLTVDGNQADIQKLILK